MKPATLHLDKQRKRWSELIEDLSNPDLEMTVETVAPIVSTFQALRRAGETFDRALVVLVGKLREQLTDGRREGCIEDHVDAADFEKDDPNEDRDASSMVEWERKAVAAENPEWRRALLNRLRHDRALKAVPANDGNSYLLPGRSSIPYLPIATREERRRVVATARVSGRSSMERDAAKR